MYRRGLYDNWRDMILHGAQTTQATALKVTQDDYSSVSFLIQKNRSVPAPHRESSLDVRQSTRRLTLTPMDRRHRPELSGSGKLTVVEVMHVSPVSQPDKEPPIDPLTFRLEREHAKNSWV